MKQSMTTSCSRSSSKEDVFLTSPQVKKSLQQDTSNTEDDKDHKEATATDEFVDHLTLSFPVAINIDEIATSTCGSTLSCMSSVNAQSTTRSSSTFNVLERNKSLAKSSGGNGSRLTVAEEDRISKILAQDDDENYKDTSTREVELDSLLNCLGYNIEINEEVADSKERGDPVLRRLAKERTMEKQKQRIDQALRVLLREPLPQVVRNDDASLQHSTTYDQETVLTTPLTEDDIQELIERAKKELEDDKLELADHESIRMLAQSIVDEESSKRSSY